MYNELYEAYESALDNLRAAIDDLRPCPGEGVNRAMLEDIAEDLTEAMEVVREKAAAEEEAERRAMEREYWEAVI